MSKIWIVAENTAWLAVLAAYAKSLQPDGEITAFVHGDEAAARQGIALGATAAFALPLPADALWESYTPLLAEKARAEQPALILLSAAKRCRDMAAQLGALLDAPCFSDVKNLSLTPDGVSGETLVYGGAGVAQATTRAATVLATVAAKACDPALADASRSGTVATLAPAPGAAQVTARLPREARSVNLDGAAKVVGVGRGLSEQKDLAGIEALAKAIGAEMACSRPIAEFFKWMPEERYIGISGQQIKPQLYLAVGISGQAQHYYGVRDAKIIVSVNKDAEALMNLNADYYIVGDWKEVAPSLIQAFGAV
ncbi:MAG: electron transfer flavoprotein subunit alpha/FixB family protein [Betaproteobacteria bacterium]|nr:electron transfer flavoprotein subunit alpha/FixB family protein [Desulfovibrionaceae bacterium]MCL1985542.1 electron transfer flavoprotein subunit alpha/FixB family protein [Betaproteobacteria bacterium]